MTQPAFDFDQRGTLTDQMAEFFRRRPNQPIDVAELARVGGISGYRTRISDCRKQYGMDIEPERPMARWPDGRPRPRAIYRPRQGAAA